MPFGTIRPQQLQEKIASGQILALVDVRTAGEYASGHAAGACSIPLNRITPEAVAACRPEGATGPTYVICQSGGRSRHACHQLAEAGLTDVVNVEGGTSAWRAAGLPMEPSVSNTHKGLPGWLRTLGLLLVLACMVLAWQVQPWFAFVGMGIWVLLLIGGGGTCPLNTCGVPTAPPRSDKV
jgi:rhodanese-related sulfurtransferase